MTTDTTALQERIARALAPSHPHPLKPEACNGCRRLRDNAAAVLPIIAAEVQAAKAEAWDEAYRCGVDDARIADGLRVEVGLGPDLYAQPARQNPYKTGDQA